MSITEQAEDNATGRLLEGIIESVDEYYSENLGPGGRTGNEGGGITRLLPSLERPLRLQAKIKVSDGAKERPTLEVDPATTPVVRELFEKSLRGSGLKELCKELNDRGITNRGKRWYKGTLHYVLRNEAYTGTAVWGKTSKGQEAQDPVRVEEAWPALVSKELFDDVQQAMSERAPKVQRPGRVGSKFLLSGLLKCGVCGRPYSAQGAKSGQFAYYNLRHPVQGGSGDVQRPIPERPQAGDVRGGEDQGAHPQRGDHRGAGDSWWQRRSTPWPGSCPAGWRSSRRSYRACGSGLRSSTRPLRRAS